MLFVALRGLSYNYSSRAVMEELLMYSREAMLLSRKHLNHGKPPRTQRQGKKRSKLVHP